MPLQFFQGPFTSAQEQDDLLFFVYLEAYQVQYALRQPTPRLCYMFACVCPLFVSMRDGVVQLWRLTN